MKKAFSSLMTLVLAFGIGLVAVLAPPIAPMDMASAEDTDPEVCLTSLGPGRYLRLSGTPHPRAWAGQFNMTVAGVPYKGWCIDTVNPIGLWCFDATLSDAPRATPWCEIGHILTNYSPDSDDDVAAAIQLALWKYMYGEHAVIATWPTSPPIEDMALDIYHDADGRTVIGPGSGLSLIPGAAGVASQKFTATISDSGCLAGIPIDFSLNFSTGTGSFSPHSALTDSAGKASVTVSWDASQTSYEFTITAHTEGDWPVEIHPEQLGPRGETIQKTIISEHYELTADEHMAWEQEVGSLEVTKVADTDISKEGDTITYTIEVCNTGEVDLTKTSIIDTLLPDINDAFGDTLAAGDCESHTFSYTVPEGAPDPLVNKVTATYEDEAETAVSDTATKSVDLVHPDIEVTKTADPTSGAVGDTITYTIEVKNTGDVDLILDSVSDSLLGSLAGFSSTLAKGASESKDFTRKIQLGDPNPLVNTVTFHYHPQDLENDITDKDDASVDLVSRCFEVTKVADTDISKEGDTITYTIEVCNTGDVDLNKKSITDTLLDDISGSFAATLAHGTCESHTFNYTVPKGAPDPVVNEVEAIYEDEAGNAVKDVATKSVDLVHPGLKVTKTAAPTVGEVGDEITYTITVENTGDVALDLDSVSDNLMGNLISDFSPTLAVGGSESKTFTRPIGSGDPDPLVNTVVFKYHPRDLTNVINHSASASVVRVGGGCETAFAYDSITCFSEYGFSRWGWSIGPLLEGDYSFDIYAGAGQCDINKGTLVGWLDVHYHDSTAIVVYSMKPGFTMDETHLYVGSEILPRNKKGEYTVAPGQYPSIHDPISTEVDKYVITGLSGPIYIVAHAVVCGDYD